MPWKPKKPCSYPGCPELTDGRYCEKHQKQENARYEKYDRDPAVLRRYGRAWKRIRDSYVKTHPSAIRTESLCRWMRSIIRFLYLKEERTIEII